MFAENTGIVPIIAPLNESVTCSCLIKLNFNRQFLFFKRPAGFYGEEIMDATKQVRYLIHLLISRFLTFVCLASTGMIVMETFGMLEKITESLSISHDICFVSQFSIWNFTRKQSRSHDP